jgi:hypothetical protein
MVIQMARGGVLYRKKIPCRIYSSHAEARVGPEPILLEIEIVLDEERATERVVPDSVAAHPRIDERQRKDEKKNQNFVVAREPSQSALSLNESQFCTRLDLRAIALRVGLRVKRKHMVLTIPFSRCCDWRKWKPWIDQPENWGQRVQQAIVIYGFVSLRDAPALVAASLRDD